MKTITTFVLIVCFNVLTAFSQQTTDLSNQLDKQESDYWPTSSKYSEEYLTNYTTLLEQRALMYNNRVSNEPGNYLYSSSVGTCNIITCGSFNHADTTPDASWGGFKTAIDGSAYAANVSYSCWNDTGTVDYSEGQYISYSEKNASVYTPAIIDQSPDGGGFAVFSYRNEAINQDLVVDPNTNYTVCFEIAVIPLYDNDTGNLLAFEPNLNFGIRYGGTVISDPLTYTHNDLNIHPASDFPLTLSTATTGPFQNPNGWTEINPFWETVCINFKSDASGIVNVFYETGNPGNSLVLVDGLRLSLEGFAVPPTLTNNPVKFCSPNTVNLNDYVSSTGPAGSVLTWSTNNDPLVISDHLTDTTISQPGTYYTFYYNIINNCASPVAQLDVIITDLDAQINSTTDVDCLGSATGAISVSGLDGTAPYSYSIDGGINYQNSGIFSNLIAGTYTIIVKDSTNCFVDITDILIDTIDVESPVISAPSNYTIEGCGTGDITSLIYSETLVIITLDQLQASLDNGGTASDDISIATISYIDETVSTINCVLEIKRTFTVTDNCGNSSSATQTITISDTTAPEFVEESLPLNVSVECDNIPDSETLTATDNCDSEIVVEFDQTRTDGDCDNNYILTRTWTAADNCGNTTTHTQTITVTDTTAPEFVEENLPSDLSVECDAVADPATLTATDNCDTEIIVEFEEVKTAGTCASNYILTRTWTATDTCNNTTTHSQTITVTDTTAPEFVEEDLPGDLSVECNSISDPATLTATDNCDAEIIVAFEEVKTDGSCTSDYILTRTWTATDACDNTVTHVQTITVTDTTAPEFVEENLPGDLSIECDAINDPATLTATDNCDSEIIVVFEEVKTDGTCASDYTLTRTWTATDACDNTATHTQTITVTDTTTPEFVEENLPGDLSVECDAVNDPATLTATDNCDTEIIVVFEEVKTDGSCASDYTLTRTWTATDACENTITHSQTITVTDTTVPTLITEYEPEISASCSEIPEVPALEFDDACNDELDEMFIETISEMNDQSYTVTRTWTVTDACANESVFTQIISVTSDGAVTATEGNELCIGDDDNFDLFDYITGDYGTNGTWETLSDNASVDGSFFNPFELEIGDYVFRYTDLESPCPSVTEITISLHDLCIPRPCNSPIISKAVTVNGDQWNEYFTVTDIEFCNFVIELQIYNRWGALIYESKNYQNDWNGQAHKNSVGSSKQVPTGTYYYILNLIDNGSNNFFTGPMFVTTK